MLIAEGEYLCLEGERGNSLYIVQSGMFKGTSRKNTESEPEYFEPGSIIGELSLLETAPRELTIQAEEDSEVLVIEQEQLKEILDAKPFWINSIMSFLVSRRHIAEENKKKSDLVQALPPLLFLFAKYIENSKTDTIPLLLLQEKLHDMNGTAPEEANHLLQILEELKLLKMERDVVRAESLQVIPLLYHTLKYRALHKQVSPNILSMTEQMVLTVFLQLAKGNRLTSNDGICTIPTELLKEEAKKSMHFTLTSRIVAPLVHKGVFVTDQPFDIHVPLDNVPCFYAEFEKSLDLLEMNRIFPLLDKKLID